MTRSLVGGALLVALGAGCSPMAGDACQQAGTGQCEGTQVLLQCLNGQVQRIPCRGPKGCVFTESSGRSFCDESIGVEMELCSGSGNACDVSGRARLECMGGLFKKAADCVTCDVTATNQVNCVAPCGAANCAGCCMGGACQTGVTATACGKGGGACLTCGAGKTCLASQTCGVDPNSMWKVQPTAFSVKTTTATGGTWDVGGGAPDPYAILACPATATMRVVTPTVSDAFTGSWATGGCVMKASDLMRDGFGIGVSDEDVADDDVIAGVGTIVPTEADLLAGSTVLSNSTTLTSLTVQFQRQ